MAFIVHKRADGSLVVDPRGDLPDRHALGEGTLQRWGVASGDPITLQTADGEVTYNFVGFDPELRQTKRLMLIYEREVTDG